MADGGQSAAAAVAGSLDGGAILFALAGHRYALPLAAVDAIMPPPALCRVPHAPPPLLGAGNLGGQVLPVIDLAELLPAPRRRRDYDGGGEVLRVSAAGGSVGVWVDRVERFIAPGTLGAPAATVIDPEPLVRAGMTAPNLAAELSRPLGDASEIVRRTTTPSAEASYFLVEAGGENIRLRRETVIEFTEAPPWVQLPGAPTGFLGVGVLHGDALPMLSLAALLDLAGRGRPNSFALVATADGDRLLLGFDRVIGLRTYRQRTGRRWVDRTSDAISGATEDGRIFDLAAAIAGELQRIVAGFAPVGAAREAADDARQSDTVQYLAFVIGGDRYALSVETVDRVVTAQAPVRLPGRKAAITGAIELRGQLVPIARLAACDEPSAYVILNAGNGMMAIGVDRVERLVALRPDQISPAPGGEDLFDGVAVLDDDDLLRILAPDRVGYG